MTLPPEAHLLVGIVDRTEELFDRTLDAAERRGLAVTVEELEVRSFGPDSPREDVMLLGPRELTRTGLRRAARYAARHPACVLVAVGVDPAGPSAADLRMHGITVVLRGALTQGKLGTTLDRAVGELLRLRTDALEGAPLGAREADDTRGPGDVEGASDPDAELALVAPDDVVEHDEVDELDEPDGMDDVDDVGDRDEVEGSDEAAADDDVEEAAPEVEVAVATPSSAFGSTEPVDGVAAASVPAQADGSRPRHRDTAALVTIASATGGCGKTFFATNLAAIVAQAGFRCLLVDLDLQFGEVAAALRIRHPYSVYDGLYDSNGRPLPAGTLEEHLESLVVHHPLGFDVLTAPRDPALADYVGARDATAILDAVEPRYDVVVVDTPPSLNEVVLTALDRSEVVTVLATLDVPSLKNLTVFLDTLARLRLDRSLLRLVLNKVEPDIGISVAQAQDAFENRFLSQIPLDRGVSRSINAGTVVVDLEPRSTVAQQLKVATRAILPADLPFAVPTVTVAKSSPLSRLLTVLRPSRRATTGGAS